MGWLEMTNMHCHFPVVHEELLWLITWKKLLYILKSVYLKTH